VARLGPFDDDAVRAAAAPQEVVDKAVVLVGARIATRCAGVGGEDNEHRPLRHRPEQAPVCLEERVDEGVGAAAR
jgi:hypothetical protein